MCSSLNVFNAEAKAIQFISDAAYVHVVDYCNGYSYKNSEQKCEHVRAKNVKGKCVMYNI